MLKGEDIVVLLKLTQANGTWTVRTLEQQTTIPRSTVQRSLKRLAEAGMFDPRRRAPNVAQAEEFLIHGVKYVYPAAPGGESRGFPTAWGAEPLAGKLARPSGDLPPVWPSAKGDTRGLVIEPLHPSVVEATRHDALLREQLALVDAIRIGDARLREVAAELLSARLNKIPT